MSCTKNGVLVKITGHDVYIMTDIYEVAGAVVIRANSPLAKSGFRTLPEGLRGVYCCNLIDRPNSGFWRDDLGVWVVPADQLQGWSEIRPKDTLYE